MILVSAGSYEPAEFIDKDDKTNEDELEE